MSKNITTTAMIAGLIGLGSVSAYAGQTAEEVIMDEARSCAAAISERVEIGGANHVRHTITDYQDAPLGYALKIRSDYFSENGSESYQVLCVANGSARPLKLRVYAVND